MALDKLYDLLHVFRDDTQEFTWMSMDDLGIETQVASTWTPTLTAGTNLDSASAGAGKYVRLGSMVLFAFTATVDPTAAAAFEFKATLPVASAFAAAGNAIGVIGGDSVSAGYVQADAASDKLTVNATAAGTAATTIFCVGIYEIL